MQVVRQGLLPVIALCCGLVATANSAPVSYLENFNAVPAGPLSQRMVGPIKVTFATGTWTGSNFSVLDAFVGHHSQLEPSRLLSNLDILLTFDPPLSEFSIQDDPATNEPGANQINVIALANNFAVLAQGAFPNDQLPQSRVTVTAAGISRIVLDIVPLPGVSDDEGFDNMILTPVPEAGTVALVMVSVASLLAGSWMRCTPECRQRHACSKAKVDAQVLSQGIGRLP